MSSDQTLLAVLENRQSTLEKRVETYHLRIHELEDMAGENQVQVQILKERVAKHSKLLTADGEAGGLAEQFRNLQSDVTEIKLDLKVQAQKKEVQAEKGKDRGWQIYIAIGLLIVKEFVTWWLSKP